MAYLLDTNIVIWWLEKSPALPGQIYKLLRDSGTRAVVSAVVAWEIAIKSSLGKLKVPGNLESVLTTQDFELLQISFKHAETVRHLPPLHRDPFDRMLVAQAIVEKLTLVTSDPRLADYGSFVKVV